ncbi:calcium-binding protein [Brevundimonas sp.]|uniref:calcium-binding protein n=1 Tax=Brevundimonas sp. TaxID=1871086 RepID=UPI0024886172|nr:calcium-binding protein [Brevundimonas sp.]MDI1279857.1 calcium-binding protein [Brevundimonas sp.]
MPGRIYVTDTVLEIGVWQTLSVVDDWVGVVFRDEYVNYGHHPVDDAGPVVVNRGTVTITSASERYSIDNWVRGIDHERGAFFMNAAFVNAAGATFSVSHTSLTGKATGFYASAWCADFTNQGLFQVSSAHIAIGIETWNGNFLDREHANNFFFDNTGDIRVAGATTAYGALFYNGAFATNSGSISVTGGQRAWGVLLFGHAPELINSGSITATTTGTEASVGVYLSGGVFGSHLVNTGTISADIAVRENDFDSRFGPNQDLIENAGRIFGHIYLLQGADEIRNSGVIHGDVVFGDQNDLFLGARGLVFGTLSMGGGDDRVEAGSGNDRIDGGAGRDEIDGGDGSDTIDGGDDDDLIFGNDGDDFLRGGAGQDFLFGGAGNDVIEASEGDALAGGAGNDLYRLGAGRDLIILELDAGDDEVIGFDPGVDRFVMSGWQFLSATVVGSDTRLTHTGGTILIRGTTGLAVSQWNALIDPTATLVGPNGISLIGSSGADDLTGGSGNDFLYGGAGHDVLRGGDGDDRLVDREGPGSFYGGAGNDLLISGDHAVLMDGGDGDDILQAGAGNDVLHGESGADTIFGGRGNDIITGGAGANTIYGGDGDDHITGGDDDDMIYGNAGQDVIHGGAGNDVIFDGGDDDLIYGGDGDDEIHVFGDGRAYGGAGADRMSAESGQVELYGEDGDDILSASATIGARLYGGDGDDEITTSLFDGYAFGGAGDDRLISSDYTALLQGGAGNDSLIGRRGYMVTADYSDADAYVTVDLRIFSAQDTHSRGFDTLTGIGNLNGSGYADILTGDLTRNILSGGLGADQLHAQEGTDLLIGGGGDDILNGGDDADILIGGDGDDLIDGGHGNDCAIFAGARALYAISVSGGVTTVTGPEGIDRLSNVEWLHFADGVFAADGSIPAGALVGTGGADALVGTAGDDVILGGDGDDVITANGGSDSIDGGDGIDTVVLTSNFAEYNVTQVGGVTTLMGNSQIVTLSGVERLQFDSQTILLAPNGGDYVTGTDGNDFLIGQGMNDHLVGGDGVDRLEGRDGDDIVDGGAGDDTIIGGDGWDVLLLGGSRDDYRVLRSGDDFIVKGPDGRDLVTGVELLRFSDGSEIDLAMTFGHEPQVLPGLMEDGFQMKGVDLVSKDSFGDAQVLPASPDNSDGYVSDSVVFERQMAAVFAGGHMPLVGADVDLVHAPWSHGGDFDLLAG